MRAICTDGTEIECTNFKAVTGGVLLTRDKKRKKAFGFVPNANLAYVLPDDVAATRSPDATVEESSTDDDSPADGDAELRITAEADEDGDEADDEDGDEADDEDDAEAGVDSDGDEADGAVIDLDADDPDEHAAPAADPDAADDPATGLVSDAPDATRIAPDEDLRRLAGLGDTYAERLRAAGVETVSDLRECSVDDVVAAARVPRGRAERWLRLVTPREDTGDAPAADPAETESEASDSG